MFNLSDVNSHQGRRHVVGQYPSFAAAMAAAYDLLPVAFLEVDHDHDGCADLITDHGSLYVIEPA